MKKITTALVMAIAIVFVPVCSNAENEKNNFSFDLSEDEIAKHSGDFQSLYDSWVFPKTSPSGHRMSGVSEQDFSAYAHQIDGVFKVFCKVSNGKLATGRVVDNGSPVGSKFECRDSKSLIARFTYFFEDGNIYFKQESDLQHKRNIERYTQEIAKSGPTGWVNSDGGRFKIIRFGDYDLVNIVTIKGRRLDEFDSVVFSPCCSVRSRDGITESIDSFDIRRWYVENSGVDVIASFGVDGFPLVVYDPIIDFVRELRFPNFDGIKSIEVDEPSKWKDKPAKDFYKISSVEEVIDKSDLLVKGKSDISNRIIALDVGDKVCVDQVSVKPIPEGQFKWGWRSKQKSDLGSVMLVGFVERINKAKVQVRISGITFVSTYGEAAQIATHHYAGSQLSVGSIVWSDRGEWKRCD